MKPGDLVALAWGALRARKVRTRMTTAAIGIGVGSVLVLTAMGEGARNWVIGRFAALGSNVIVVLPGRTETRGGPPIAVATTRDMTLEDFEAVRRRLVGLQRAVPITIGEATLEAGGRSRASTIMGTTADFLRIRDIPVDAGSNLPDLAADERMNVCVLGRTVQRELFGTEPAVGRRIRIGGTSFRVAGAIGRRGESMMVNLDEIVLVPVATALRMFNRSGLFRIIVQVTATANLASTQERLTALLRERHDGEEDFTVLTPGAIASSLGAIIRIITAGLAAIAAVSLAVAGIGVMNVMIVSVTERTSEIGLMKAVGASNRQILALFLAEAVVLALLGGALGIVSGVALAKGGTLLYPEIPFRVPGWALGLAAGVAATVGIAFGLLPALRAARLEPLDALRRTV